MTSPKKLQAPLTAPLRMVHIALILGLGVATVVNFAFGVWKTGLATGFGTVVTAVAWRMAASGRFGLSAALTFYMVAFTFAALVFFGHGTRDYSLIAIPAFVFAGSMFLEPRAYWTLGGCILAGAVGLGYAELAGWYVARPVPVTGARELINLALIVGTAVIGGRGLMHAIRSAFAREQALSGALLASQERIQKLFRSSQNPIVVSRLEDGRYIEVNEAYLSLFGFEREEVIGHTAVELRVWEEPRERDRFVRIMRERGAVSDFETRMRKRSGEVIEVLFSAELIEAGGESCLLVYIADVTAQRQAERLAEQLAVRDALTGLPNRVAAIDRLQHALQRAMVSGRPLGIVHVGLDRFKAVNDSLGYTAGDRLLREVAGRLETVLARGDTLARIAGDEFLLIAESLERAEGAVALAERAVVEIRRPFTLEQRELRLTACAGVSVGPEHSVDAERFLQRADTALHAAKGEGRGTCRVYGEAMSGRFPDRLSIESALREAIARGGLRLAYQPKVALRTRAVNGLEALARWHHPELGDVPPSIFIPIAEESGLVQELGSWVLDEACRQVASWRARGLACPPVAVNVSAPQFTPDLPGLIADSERRHALAPGAIEIEVTESMLIRNPEAARRLLQQIAARGNRIMLDDFGVGYSSLGYIRELELHGIKVDRTFIRGLAGSRRDAAIVQAIVGLAHGLGLRVVGEGVEFEAQAEALIGLGCDEAQGFLFGRPMDGEEIAARVLAP